MQGEVVSRHLGRHGSVQLARSSASIVDRGSLFTAQVVWPVRSVAAAHAAIVLMRGEGDAAGADHNMTAFRVREAGKLQKAYDDDGESNGGQRLMGCLTRLKATDVAVMVSRVYGGQNWLCRRWLQRRQKARTDRGCRSSCRSRGGRTAALDGRGRRAACAAGIDLCMISR